MYVITATAVSTDQTDDERACAKAPAPSSPSTLYWLTDTSSPSSFSAIRARSVRRASLPRYTAWILMAAACWRAISLG